jgi:hypothetical protein
MERKMKLLVKHGEKSPQPPIIKSKNPSRSFFAPSPAREGEEKYFRSLRLVKRHSLKAWPLAFP